MRKLRLIVLSVALLVSLCGCKLMPADLEKELAARTEDTQDEVTAAPEGQPEASSQPPEAAEEPKRVLTLEEASAGRAKVAVDIIIETSNRDSRYYGKYAVDGDGGTCWTSRAEDTGPCIAFTFARQGVVDSVALLPGDQHGVEPSGSPLSIQLIFDDESTEQFVIPKLAPGEAWVGTFEPRAAGAVVLYVTSYSGSAGASIAECVFFSEEGS